MSDPKRPFVFSDDFSTEEVTAECPVARGTEPLPPLGEEFEEFERARRGLRLDVERKDRS